MKAKANDTKKLFRKLGSCSRTYFYILNREFGHTKEIEERAADPLAGGLMQTGHQCGMLGDLHWLWERDPFAGPMTTVKPSV